MGGGGIGSKNFYIYKTFTQTLFKISRQLVFGNPIQLIYKALAQPFCKTSNVIMHKITLILGTKMLTNRLRKCFISPACFPGLR
jgi:hypothetical protein